MGGGGRLDFNPCKQILATLQSVELSLGGPYENALNLAIAKFSMSMRQP